MKLAYGSDLLGSMHQRQSEELVLRTRAFSTHEVICQATSVAAEVLNKTGALGVVAAGATADLLVVNGDPLKNIGVLGEQGRYLDVVMKQGHFFKSRIASRPCVSRAQLDVKVTERAGKNAKVRKWRCPGRRSLVLASHEGRLYRKLNFPYRVGFVETVEVLCWKANDGNGRSRIKTQITRF